MRRLTRWLRRCFPQPIPAMRWQWPAWLLDLAWRLQATAYEPRHLSSIPAHEFRAISIEPRTEPLAITAAPSSSAAGHPIGSLRVWAPEAERYIEPAPVTGEILMLANRYGVDPADAPFDLALSWGAAWKAHERGDEAAVQSWLDAGWLADAYWLRMPGRQPCAA